jgi:hypothetical protein
MRLSSSSSARKVCWIAAVVRPGRKAKPNQVLSYPDGFPCRRANTLLKGTFAALQLVSLSPTRVGAITKAALVLLHLEHGRPIPRDYAT